MRKNMPILAVVPWVIPGHSGWNRHGVSNGSSALRSLVIGHLTKMISTSNGSRIELSEFVRRSAARALGAGWGGDPEVRNALLAVRTARALDGSFAEPDEGVRANALSALGTGWPGDAEVRDILLAALLIRKLHRLPPAGIQSP